jgi:hypothetical protein
MVRWNTGLARSARAHRRRCSPWTPAHRREGRTRLAPPVRPVWLASMWVRKVAADRESAADDRSRHPSRAIAEPARPTTTARAELRLTRTSIASHPPHGHSSLNAKSYSPLRRQSIAFLRGIGHVACLAREGKAPVARFADGWSAPLPRPVCDRRLLRSDAAQRTNRCADGNGLEHGAGLEQTADSIVLALFLSSLATFMLGLVVIYPMPGHASTWCGRVIS